MLAAPPCEAFSLWCRGDGCVARDNVKKRAGEEFKALSDDIKAKQSSDPMMGVYLNQIRDTEKRFNSQADAVLKRPAYAVWEFEFLRQEVSSVIIPTIKNAVAASAAMPVADRPAAFNDGLASSQGLQTRFKASFLHVNAARMIASDPGEQVSNTTGENGKQVPPSENAGNAMGTGLSEISHKFPKDPEGGRARTP
ncbi:MAG: hypothetical protein PHS14_11995, partial [Elusimicrobia bacterium]|nr:hypothetical protein [Elusimicrobiota bacterium]